jgi:Family of unknown function (DUF6328)
VSTLTVHATTDSPREANDDPGRHETDAERQDRNFAELLQELRVAGIGVQVLFGFLLSLPFNSRFSHLAVSQHRLYLVTVVLTVLAIAQLSAPVAYHRLVFRRHQKEGLVSMANTLALSGLTTVALSLLGALLLVATVVVHGWWISVIVAVPAAVFIGLWLVLPLQRRLIAHRAGADQTT